MRDKDFPFLEIPSLCICEWKKIAGMWYWVSDNRECPRHFTDCAGCDGTGRIEWP